MYFCYYANFKTKIMVVISATEFSNNTQKYLDIAQNEPVSINRGKGESFTLTSDRILEPDEDLARAITLDELLEGVKADIKEMFKNGKKGEKCE